MITVKVKAEEGWQNGETQYPCGRLLELDVSEKDIQAYIDSGALELVKPEIDVDEVDPQKEMKAVVNTALQTFMAAQEKLNPRSPNFQVRERADEDPKGGFKSFADFAITAYKGDMPGGENIDAKKRIGEWDKRVAAKTAGHMAEGEPTEGGHLVPEEFRATLLQTSLENAVVRPRATFVPMATNRIGFPAISDYDHRNSGSGLFGAIKIYRPGEAAAKTESKPHFDKINLTLHKNVAYTYVSDELMEDSPISIEPLLNTLFGKAIAWHEDKFIVPCSRKAA